MADTPNSVVRFGILGSANLRKVIRAIDLAPNSTLHAVAGQPPSTGCRIPSRFVVATMSVQFMDPSSTWLYHSRTTTMKQKLLDSKCLRHIYHMYSTMTTLASDIRINPDMDALGAIAEMVWIYLGAVLWVQKYELPSSIIALPGPTKSLDGILLSCTSSIHYNQPEWSSAKITDTEGLLCLQDLMIPPKETSATFAVTLGAKLTELHLGWTVKPEKVVVDCKMPQEALMVEEFASLVEGIKRRGCQPDCKWLEISRKTQAVFGALNKSINLGCTPVYL
ncbi:hypothetical protein SLE2022_274090 [Rubroshorea leprosula]